MVLFFLLQIAFILIHLLLIHFEVFNVINIVIQTYLIFTIYKYFAAVNFRLTLFSHFWDSTWFLLINEVFEL